MNACTGLGHWIDTFICLFVNSLVRNFIVAARSLVSSFRAWMSGWSGPQWLGNNSWRNDTGRVSQGKNVTNKRTAELGRGSRGRGAQIQWYYVHLLFTTNCCILSPAPCIALHVALHCTALCTALHCTLHCTGASGPCSSLWCNPAATEYSTAAAATEYSTAAAAAGETAEVNTTKISITAISAGFTTTGDDISRTNAEKLARKRCFEKLENVFILTFPDCDARGWNLPLLAESGGNYEGGKEGILWIVRSGATTFRRRFINWLKLLPKDDYPT